MVGSAERVAAGARDADAVSRGLHQLGVPWSPDSVLRLSGGHSAAGVFLLSTSGGRCVLKVTTSRSWRARAVREVRFYHDLAPELPIPVPALLDTSVTDEGVCLLLSARSGQSSARDWSVDWWVEAAAQAGRLHRHGAAVARPTWLEHPAQPRQDAVTRAAAQWNELGHPEVADRLPTLLAEACQVLGEAQPTIIHGDCHVENLLPSADGEPVWVDWQEVSTGAGPEDLALLWQRAEFDGADPPRSPMMTAYRDARETTDEPLEQLVLAAELRLLLLEWPHFLPFGDVRQQQVLLSRLRDVQHQWGR